MVQAIIPRTHHTISHQNKKTFGVATIFKGVLSLQNHQNPLPITSPSSVKEDDPKYTSDLCWDQQNAPTEHCYSIYLCHTWNKDHVPWVFPHWEPNSLFYDYPHTSVAELLMFTFHYWMRHYMKTLPFRFLLVYIINLPALQKSRTRTLFFHSSCETMSIDKCALKLQDHII